MKKSDIEKARQALAVLMKLGEVRELRIPKAGKLRTISGYFDDPEKLSEAIAELSGEAEGVYFTLNPCKPELLARASNRWKPYAEVTTNDRDILKRVWILIDIDPVRPSGVSASQVEKDAAKAKAREVRGWLTERLWPMPVPADSGNGFHLLYSVDLPNTDEVTSLVKDCLNALAAKFDDEICKVDTSVFNAARIVKAYGSLAAKGDSTSDRPHRIAGLLKADYSAVAPVPLELLQALADEAPKKEQGQQKTAAIQTDAKIAPEKVEGFMAHYAIEHGDRRRIADGWMWHPKPCPLNPEHIGTSPAIILRDNGQLCWECKHDSCQMTWKEFRQKMEELHPDKPKFRFFEQEKLDWSKWNVEEVELDENGDVAAPLKSWNEIADVLDEVRKGTEEYIDGKGNVKTKKKPKHIVEEEVLQFVLGAYRCRAKMFFDAYPYVYLPTESEIIRFHDDREAYTLLGKLRLRKEQHDSKLVKENLALHILSHGDATQIERWGCFRDDAIYINNGRKGMFKLTVKSIEEVENGTDGVYMLAPEVAPWPELNEENVMLMKSISKDLGKHGMKVSDSVLCHHLNALFEPEKLTTSQYQQLFLTRYLSLFLSGYMKLRPIMMALGEQNSGKSTLFEKIMWTVVGSGYESEGLPKDLRGMLAAITNHHLKIFDNIDSADVEELGYADYFCKAATGGTVSIAQLYSTNVDRLFNLRCDLFFTSRYNPWPSHRSDLSRRTLFFPIRKPGKGEYKTVEVMQQELAADRDVMLLETLVRLQKVLRGLVANKEHEYPPQSEMHSYETFTMRVADYEGWADEMKAIWKGYFSDYQDRVTEYSPIVDELRKWLGFPGLENNYPNVNRWVLTSELFKDIKKLGGRDCTWKNESTFGRAFEKHFSALRVLGADKKKSSGYKYIMFSPSPEQFEACKAAYQACGSRLYSFREDFMPEEVM